jgi:hypothetical protein
LPGVTGMSSSSRSDAPLGSFSDDLNRFQSISLEDWGEAPSSKQQ